MANAKPPATETVPEHEISTAVVVPFPQMAKMIRTLEERMVDFEGDDTVAVRIADELLAAETEEELFALNAGETIASKEFLGKPFLFGADDVKFLRSTIEDGSFPFFALITVVDLADGAVKVINSGAMSVLPILYKLLQWHADGRDTFTKFEGGRRPFQFVDKETRSGWRVVKLVPVQLAAYSAKS